MTETDFEQNVTGRFSAIETILALSCVKKYYCMWCVMQTSPFKQSLLPGKHFLVSENIWMSCC